MKTSSRMKTKKLLFGLAGIAVTAAALFTGYTVINSNQAHYKPTTLAAAENEEETGRGGAEWFFNIQKNAAGVIDEQAMLTAQKQVEQQALALASSNNITTAAANWTEIGPDNVGGRTRALLIDRSNPNRMYAGGISGGLWVSNDAGANWAQHPQLVTMRNNCISTICQAANGDLYFGTGEGLYYLLGTGAGGFIGGGIWKSTDGGTTFARLSATVPDSNSTSGQWTSVNKMAADPTNPNRIYAATNKGLMMTDDGGTTWVNPVVVNNITQQGKCSDVDVASTGYVLAGVSNKPWISQSGNTGTFTNMQPVGTGFPSSTGRVEFAIAPSNPNYIYAMAAKASPATLQGVYLSVDGGTNWTTLALGGNPTFEPFGTNGQGDYDNAVAVDPSDPGRAFFGGVELWKWEMVTNNPPAGQWTRAAFEFPASAFNPWYVHSDKHIIVFHPTNYNVIYVGSDGGVAKTFNKGATWIAANKGYGVTQCYSVAMDYSAPSRALAAAGTQDNGTQFVDGLGNTAMSAVSISGGDGGHTEISYLNPNAFFTTVYYGSCDRSSNRGSSGSAFYNARINSYTGIGTSGANFVTPISLYENRTQTNSVDSITFINAMIDQNITLTPGNVSTFTGTITPAQPNATIVLDSVFFTVGVDTVVCDAAGTLSGDGTGSVQTTGAFTITLNNMPTNGQLLAAHYYVRYNSGIQMYLNSFTHNLPYTYLNLATINPGDTVKIQDPVQARLVVGFTTSGSAGSGTDRGVMLCKAPLDFSQTPEWIKIAAARSKPSAFSGEVSTMKWSPDGDHLYVGTSGGSLFRVSGLNSVRDSAHADIDSANAARVLTPITCTKIAGFNGQYVTGIDVDPNNQNRLIVSVGGYGSSTYIYLCTTATTAGVSSAPTPNFTSKQGTGSNKLIDMPVYSCSFDKYVNNRVLIGTEYGVYECADITASAASLNWQPSVSGGLPRVPVLMIRQARYNPWEIQNAGVFYIGTHGRGIWRDESSWQQPNGINDPYSPSNNVANLDIKVFPNPVTEGASATFKMAKGGDATLEIYDLQGKRVLTQVYRQLNAGENTIRFDAANLQVGTYLINITSGSNRVGTSRFVKLR